MICEVGKLTGHCGLCLAGRRGRAVFKNHATCGNVKARRGALPMKFVKKSATGKGGQPAEPVKADGGDLEAICPALLEFLTAGRWEDGSPRKVGTVLYVWEDGLWKAWLHDRDGKRSAWVSGRTPLDLILAIEEGFINDGLGWRADKGR